MIHEPVESPAQSWRAPAGPGIGGSMSKSLTAKGMNTIQPETQYFGTQRVLSSGAKPRKDVTSAHLAVLCCTWKPEGHSPPTKSISPEDQHQGLCLKMCLERNSQHHRWKPVLPGPTCLGTMSSPLLFFSRQLYPGRGISWCVSSWERRGTEAGGTGWRGTSCIW